MAVTKSNLNLYIGDLSALQMFIHHYKKYGRGNLNNIEYIFLKILSLCRFVITPYLCLLAIGRIVSFLFLEKGNIMRSVYMVRRSDTTL